MPCGVVKKKKKQAQEVSAGTCHRGMDYLLKCKHAYLHITHRHFVEASNFHKKRELEERAIQLSFKEGRDNDQQNTSRQMKPQRVRRQQ